MKVTIQGIPRFEFEEITLAEVEALRTLAAMHYDYVCKQAADGAGVLGTWKRQLEDAAHINSMIAAGGDRYEPRLDATSNQLQTLAKITEFTNFVGVDDNLRQVGVKFHMLCQRAFNHFNPLYAVWRVEV